MARLSTTEQKGVVDGERSSSQEAVEADEDGKEFKASRIANGDGRENGTEVWESGPAAEPEWEGSLMANADRSICRGLVGGGVAVREGSGSGGQDGV